MYKGHMYNRGICCDTCTSKVKRLTKGATAPKMNPEINKIRNDLDKTVDPVKSLI